MASFATQVQIRRGTDAENDAFTGAEGEVTMDLTNKQLRVHDGQTTGGMKIPNIKTVFGTNQIANNAVTEEKIADNAVTGGKIADGAITEPKLSADLQTKINEKTSGAGRNIGDIFWTTRTDSALNGAVEANGAQYNFADVNGGANNIKALLDANKIAYISIADYESAISSKGWCDKFGYDSGATSFRVPKLTPYIVQKENIPVNLSIDTIAGGTYNVSHTINGKATNLNAGTRNASKDVQSTYINEAMGKRYNILSKVTIPDKDINGEASINLSNIALQGRIMVQLFNGATDEALTTCTEVLADVAGLKLNKADTDLSNVSSNIDYVIESQEPTEANGYTWYRLYKSGWVEQGGYVSYTGSWIKEHIDSVVLPIEFANTDYRIMIGRTLPSDGDILTSFDRNKTTTGFGISSYAVNQSTAVASNWFAVGMSAQGSN